MNKGLLSILQLLKTQGFKQRGVTIYGDGWVQLSLTRCPTNGLTECVSILVMSEPPEEEEEPEEEEAEQEELGSKEFAKGSSSPKVNRGYYCS